ncbi:sugar phosphate isomerase/epimerase family protein [Synoicihabitans lomoniglobus]|uniref:Sugar phosphate isomerase/epimerase n=1 Tax=Synoicihabitans lomoniglobus TaxID=2909285 RepID=A0AAE9ZWV4_9BACT|nr:sugar phosphate isomerase/epimerase [Opitutaceae bacterium LMO-M01]WED65761.1 sugar phosphate isomerase/epimerase [Opitutaceae bacterium LMO-M01]
MPAPRLSLQLYSLRDKTKEDFAATVSAVAQMGYAGVETAGFGNLDAAAGSAAIRDAGLEVSGMHVGIHLLRGEFNRVVDEALLCGTKNIICPFWPKAHFRTADACRRIGRDLNEIGARLRGLGFQFHYHNHDGEIALVEGRRVFDWMLDAAAPENLGCQADVYWVHVGGKDPAEFIREQGRRITLLHIKDEKEIGSGPVDFPAVFAAAESVDAAEWYVIEVEKYNHDPLESVRLSLEQMRTWGKA